MYDYIPPRARDWAIPLAGAVSVGVVSLAAREPSTLGMVGLGLAAVGVTWATVNFAIHVSSVMGEIRRSVRDGEYRFSQNYQAELISKMNPDQLRVWSRHGRGVLARITSQDQPVDRIDGEPVFLYTAWYILLNSNSRSVYAINNFKQGTFHFDAMGTHEWDDYTQARAFTALLCLYGFAEWSVGNTSATWREGGYEDAWKWLGLTRESYDTPELG